jgi:uncharacterized membrane protein
VRAKTRAQEAPSSADHDSGRRRRWDVWAPILSGVRGLREMSHEERLHKLGPIAALLVLVIAYAVFYGMWSVRKYHAFHAPAFDMGIFDQGVWLLSHFKSPFVTIYGQNMFGDHTVFIMLFFVPLYWLWSTPETLLVVQAMALAVGGFPVYLIGRKVLRSRWLALIPTLAYLLYPALGWLNLENFHPDAFYVPLALFALCFAAYGRWRRYLVMVALLLLVKEDAWLFLVPLGAFVAIRLNRKIGLVTVGLAVGWFVLVFWGLQPWLSGASAGAYDAWRIPFGGAGGLAKMAVTQPWEVIAYMLTADKIKYLLQLLTPLLFLPLLDWRSLIAVPVLFFNLISTFWYQSNLKYHYTSLIIPVLCVSAIYGLERFRKLNVRWALVTCALLVTVVCGYFWGPLPGSRVPSSFPDPKYAACLAADEALTLIPPDAVVAAEDKFAAHLANREVVYVFPNPYSASYWGDDSMKGQRLPGTEKVEYIMVTPAILGTEGAKVYVRLPEEGFRPIFHKAGIVVLRREVAE